MTLNVETNGFKQLSPLETRQLADLLIELEWNMIALDNIRYELSEAKKNLMEVGDSL